MLVPDTDCIVVSIITLYMYIHADVKTMTMVITKGNMQVHRAELLLINTSTGTVFNHSKWFIFRC